MIARRRIDDDSSEEGTAEVDGRYWSDGESLLVSVDSWRRNERVTVDTKGWKSVSGQSSAIRKDSLDSRLGIAVPVPVVDESIVAAVSDDQRQSASASNRNWSPFEFAKELVEPVVASLSPSHHSSYCLTHLDRSRLAKTIHSPSSSPPSRPFSARPTIFYSAAANRSDSSWPSYTTTSQTHSAAVPPSVLETVQLERVSPPSPRRPASAVLPSTPCA